MAALYVMVGLAVLLPLSGLVDLMLTSQRYDVSAGQQAATTSERIATIQHLFYQALASYAVAQQGSATTPATISATTTCPVFGASSDLQPAPASVAQTLMTGCSYVSKSSSTVRLEVKSVVPSLAAMTTLDLVPKTIVITQACVVTTSQETCPSAYAP